MFEGDALATELTVERLHDNNLVELRALTRTDEREVLDWRFTGLTA